MIDDSMIRRDLPDGRFIMHRPYWFSPKQIATIEETKNAVYIGAWAAKTISKTWSENPLDVFFQPEPDVSKGHSPHFGLLYRDSIMYITRAESCFEEPINAIQTADGELMYSGYRHDYYSCGDNMVDGGRDYFRYSMGVGSKATILVPSNGSFITKNGELEETNVAEKTDECT